MDNFYYIRKDCRLCGSGDLVLAASLAPMPLATPNLRLRNFDRGHPLYRQAVPLDLHICQHCGLLQLIHVWVDHTNADYFAPSSMTSPGMLQHLQAEVEDVLDRVRPPVGSLAVEFGVAARHGSTLPFFKALGLRVYGCDPMYSPSTEDVINDVPFLCADFTSAAADRIRSEVGPASIVILNNILANIDRIDDLIMGVRNLLTEDGVFVFETGYGLDVIQGVLLDTIYHDHLSYFCVRPLQMYFHSIGMEIIDVTHIQAKGGSLRVSVQKIGGPHSISASVSAFIAREINAGAFDLLLYKTFSQRIVKLKSNIWNIIDGDKNKKNVVAGFGVSVGTSALLAQFDLGDKISMLFDDHLDKEPELSGPGYDIPIFHSSALSAISPNLMIVFAWRYARTILAKQQLWLSNGGVAIMPLTGVVDLQSNK